MQEISDEIKGKWRQLCRLLISYNDFKQSADIAHFYLEGDYDVDRIEWDGDDNYKRRVIGEAMNSAMIISYARPFSGNDKKTIEKIPDLPGKYVRHLDKRGRQVHELVIKDRNSKMAHSDSDANIMIPQVLDLGKGRKLVVPFHSDTQAPLSKENIRILLSNCNIYMKSIIKARMDLEGQLQGYLHLLPVTNEDGG